MSSKYRVTVQYDPKRGAYIARAPELAGCEVEAESRAEAVSHLEEELDAQVETMRDQGNPAPRAVDDWDPQDEQAEPGDADIGNDISARVSKSVHRELVSHARAEGLSQDELVAELIVEGLALRSGRNLRKRRGRRADGNQRNDQRGNQRNRDQHRGNRRSYSDIMDDKASFLEYVRNVEQESTGNRGGGNRRNNRRRGGRGRNDD